MNKTITMIEAMNFFEYIEKNTGIANYEIEGWKVWPIFRINLSFNLTVKSNENIKQQRIKQLLKKPRALLYYIYSIFRLLKLLKMGGKDYDVAIRTSTDIRGDFINGKHKDVIFDDLIENMPNNSFFVMEDLGYGFKRLKPTFTKADIYSEGWRILYKLRKTGVDINKIQKIKEEIIKELENLKDKSKKEWEIEKTLEYMNAKFMKRMVDFFKIKSLFHDIFEKTSPKIYLTSCTYGYEGIIAAAKELNIPAVDILHGMMHKYHHGYIFGKHLKKYKDKFPVADYILTQNKDSTDIFLKNTFWEKNKVITVGNLRIDFWKKRLDNTDKIFRNVFFALEGEDSEIINFAEKTMEILKNKGVEVKFSLKMHPGEKLFLNNLIKLKEKFPENIDIIDADALNLYEFIANSDLNVSIGSTIHFEAVSLGKPTVMAGIKEWRYLEKIVKDGSGKLAKTPEEMAQIIVHTINRDKYYKNWMKKVIKNSKKYQEEDSIKKAVNVLEQILKNNLCNNNA